MAAEPSPAADNGRGAGGRFLPGNRIGKGNPLAARVQRLRFAVVEAATPAAVKRIIRKMIVLAENGDVQAARLVLDRCLGAPLPVDLIERLEALEVEVSRGSEAPTEED